MIARGREFLERQGLEGARREAELLVAHALGMERLQLFLALERPVDADEVVRARELLVRRGKGEPVAYLTGEREFYGRPFVVGPGVLVPRPETELLVDLAREQLADLGAPRVADIGTGSGCIAVTLALELAGSHVVAVERSPVALEFARRNAEALGAAVDLRPGDGLTPLADLAGELDLLVSNPPYVVEGDGALAPEVARHEPAEALYAPAGDPDHWVRRLCDEGRALLAPGGRLLVELGHDQGPRALEIARGLGLEGTLHADLAGVERVLDARIADGG